MRQLEEKGLHCYKWMWCKGTSPDVVALTCVINGYNLVHLVENGHMFLVNMSSKFGVKSALNHYTCMADLFGHASNLKKAVQGIQEPLSSDYSAA